MQKNKRRPYSKYYGQGDPEWWCPQCGNPIPDEQEELRCLLCENRATAPDPGDAPVDQPLAERFHLLQLQKHIHRAIGRTVPIEQILKMLSTLAEANDDASSET